MKTNEYGQVKFSEQEIINMIYCGENIDDCVLENHDAKHQLFADYFAVKKQSLHSDIEQSVEEYHKSKSNKWSLPDAFQKMDIENYLAEKLVNKGLANDQYGKRLADELLEFKSRNMMNVLRFLCYLMTTCKQNNIVTGIGRGSSVSSLVLHLLDVHQIDPVKYNLNYKEFLR